MTPHIKAKQGEIAKIVLMPGDPLRAKWIAETFLENAILVNDVRGMYCYTGTYKNKKVSVMGHGMGIPSIGIYTYELFNVYNVDTIIRIGSAGSYVKEVNVGDLFLVNEAYSESEYAKLLGLNETNVIKAPSPNLNKLIELTAKEMQISLTIGRCYSSDVFYANEDFSTSHKRTQSLVVEMEAFGLFANSIKLNKQSATILTCSDSFITKESLPPLERQQNFSNMVKLSLETILKL